MATMATEAQTNKMRQRKSEQLRFESGKGPFANWREASLYSWDVGKTLAFSMIFIFFFCLNAKVFFSKSGVLPLVFFWVKKKN